MFDGPLPQSETEDVENEILICCWDKSAGVWNTITPTMLYDAIVSKLVTDGILPPPAEP